MSAGPEEGGLPDLSVDPELLAAFLDETEEALGGLDALFVCLESAPDDRQTVEAIFRPVHSLKGNSAFFGFLQAKRLAHEMETILDHVRKGRARATRPVIDVLLMGVDGLKGMLARLRAGAPEVIDAVAHEALVQRVMEVGGGCAGPAVDWDATLRDLEAVQAHLPPGVEVVEAVARVRSALRAAAGAMTSARMSSHPVLPAAVAPTALEPRAAAEEPPRQERSDRFARTGEAGKTMRVAEASIDTFLHYVGELVVVGDLFDHLARRLMALPGAGPLARDVRRANETFAGLSNQLQRSIMAIRRVSVRPLLQKAPRLVRDVAAAKGKDIAVQLVGEAVEVDKAVIDLLDAPLTHLVRNAADHGIETPDQRMAAGKPPRGTVTISAIEGESTLTITVEDDGAGLNLDAIRRKGEQIGAIQPGQNLSQDDIVSLIFASGLSTADKVTDISGRGVGMDVVKRAVEDAGGAITVSTERGRGSRFAVRLPKGVSTQIISGYLVRVGGHTFVLPLDRVRETFKALPDDVAEVAGSRRLIRRHDQLIPLVALPAVFGGGAALIPERGCPVVTVQASRRPLALAVDGVVGVQKVVVRPLQGLSDPGLLFSGGALLGDGTVALIIDFDHLYDLG